jgi:hypothetical protein
MSGCESILPGLIDEFQSGTPIYPVFFSGKDCSGKRWPQSANEFKLLEHVGTDIQSVLCEGHHNCRIPIIQSMILPKNMRVEMVANKKLENGDPASEYVLEYGALNLYSDNESITDNIAADLVSSPFSWNSDYENCTSGEIDGCKGNAADPVNNRLDDKLEQCYTQLPLTTYANGGNMFIDGKMLATLVSCGVPLVPSLIGLDLTRFNAESTSENSIPRCDENIITSGSPSDMSESRWKSSICAPLNGMYKNLYDRIDANSEFIKNEYNIGDKYSMEALTSRAGWGTYNDKYGLQTCGCMTNAPIGEHEKVIYTISPSSEEKCPPSSCGTCEYTTIDTSLSITGIYKSVCIGRDVIRGSVGGFRINYIDAPRNIAKKTGGNVITWEETQLILCVTGMTLGGVEIKSYGRASPTCDPIVRLACSSTVATTTSSVVETACGCVEQERKLKSQFIGIDLPIQCFSTLCSLTDSDIYKTVSQSRGCNAKLCEQTLRIHGQSMVAQGTQTIVCDSKIYNLEDLPPVGKSPFVNQAGVTLTPLDPAAEFVFGPVFYVSLGLFAVLLLLLSIWGIRKTRAYRRHTKMRKEEIESLLLKEIG